MKQYLIAIAALIAIPINSAFALDICSKVVIFQANAQSVCEELCQARLTPDQLKEVTGLNVAAYSSLVMQWSGQWT